MCIRDSAQSTQEEKDAAAAVVDYLLHSVEANEILLAERGVPINTTVREACLLYTSRCV